MKRLLCLFVLSIFATSCGTGSAPNALPAIVPTVHAASAPANCNATSQSCSLMQVHSWGYCLWETHQTGKTFSGQLEIGIKSQPTDPNDSLCFISLASGGTISNVGGTVSYLPQGPSTSSMVMLLRACTTLGCAFPAEQEYLYAAKLQANPPNVTAISYHQPVPNIPTTGFVVVFNDDLAKPSNISVTFSGSFAQ